MTWEELVGWHLADPMAYCMKTPEFFVMGRPVIHTAPPDDLRDLRIRFPLASCDAWFLFAFAGDMGKAVRVMSDELHCFPWIGWERYGSTENDCHWHQVNRIKAQLAPR